MSHRSILSQVKDLCEDCYRCIEANRGSCWELSSSKSWRTALCHIEAFCHRSKICVRIATGALKLIEDLIGSCRTLYLGIWRKLVDVPQLKINIRLDCIAVMLMLFRALTGRTLGLA